MYKDGDPDIEYIEYPVLLVPKNPWLVRSEVTCGRLSPGRTILSSASLWEWHPVLLTETEKSS